MTETEMMVLRAKVRFANHYLEQIAKRGITVDLSDALSLVTMAMRPYVEIVTDAERLKDGLGYIRIRGAA